MCEDFLLRTNPSRPVSSMNQDVGALLQHLDTASNGSAAPTNQSDARPVPSLSADLALDHRCGKPFAAAYYGNRNSLFLRWLYSTASLLADHDQRLTQFAVQREIFLAFFGHPNSFHAWPDESQDLILKDVRVEDSEMQEEPIGEQVQTAAPFDFDDDEDNWCDKDVSGSGHVHGSTDYENTNPTTATNSDSNPTFETADPGPNELNDVEMQTNPNLEGNQTNNVELQEPQDLEMANSTSDSNLIRETADSGPGQSNQTETQLIAPSPSSNALINSENQQNTAVLHQPPVETHTGAEDSGRALVLHNAESIDTANNTIYPPPQSQNLQSPSSNQQQMVVAANTSHSGQTSQNSLVRQYWSKAAFEFSNYPILIATFLDNMKQFTANKFATVPNLYLFAKNGPSDRARAKVAFCLDEADRRSFEKAFIFTPISDDKILGGFKSVSSQDWHKVASPNGKVIAVGPSKLELHAVQQSIDPDITRRRERYTKRLFTDDVNQALIEDEDEVL